MSSDLVRVKARAKEEIAEAKARAKSAIEHAKATARKSQASGSTQAAFEGLGMVGESVMKKKGGDAYKYVPVAALAIEAYCYYKGTEKPSAMLLDTAAAARGARARASITLVDELVDKVLG